MRINNLEECKTLSDVVLLTSDNQGRFFYVFSYKELVATVGLQNISSTKDYLLGEISDISIKSVVPIKALSEITDKSYLEVILTNIEGSKILIITISSYISNLEHFCDMLVLLSKLFKLDGIYKYY